LAKITIVLKFRRIVLYLDFLHWSVNLRFLYLELRDYLLFFDFLLLRLGHYLELAHVV